MAVAINSEGIMVDGVLKIGLDIQTEVDNKANIGGDNTQTFKVADAVNADEAVSKGQLEVAVNGAGKVLQVIQNHVTATSSQSITENERTDIVNLNATITPSSTNSRIRITVRWNGEGSSTNNQDTVFGIRRNGTDIGNPPSAGNRICGIAIIAQGYWNSNADTTPDSCFYEYIDTPNSTSPITYAATFLSCHDQTLYNNRTVSDSDEVSRERLTSTIILEEIGA